jgi:hypothetical protein
MPAMYFDTSVLIEYWLAEGTEADISPDMSFTLEHEEPIKTVLIELMRSERDFDKIIEIRRRICQGKAKVQAIVTPLSLIELIEWYSESAFKNTAVDITGIKFMQRKSKKQVGEYLRKTLDWYQKEVKEKKGKNKIISSGLEQLVQGTFLNPSFAVAHGLSGVLLVDIVNLNVSIQKVWSELIWQAYLQIGLSDLMHVFLAKHLGCQYVASFDSDFRRLFDCWGDLIGMKLLSNPEEILDVL